jgi:hypothetical protein
MQKLLNLLAGLFLGLACYSPVALAKETAAADTLSPWKVFGVYSLNFNQVYLSNWVAGGESSVSGNTLFNISATYKKDKISWDNFLDLAFGGLVQGERTPVKTDDRIEFGSKFGYEARKSLYYSAILNFRTQFAPGFKLPNDSVVISEFLAPAFINVGLGMDYKPNDDFAVFFGPLSTRITIVQNQTLANEGAFGVEKAVLDANGQVITLGENIRYELGAFLKMSLKRKIMENVNFQTKLDLFSNYLDSPDDIIVNWETLTSFKVNKFISTTVSTNLIYDHNINIPIDSNNDGLAEKTGPRVQFKQVLAIGLTYKF